MTKVDPSFTKEPQEVLHKGTGRTSSLTNNKTTGGLLGWDCGVLSKVAQTTFGRKKDSQDVITRTLRVVVLWGSNNNNKMMMVVVVWVGVECPWISFKIIILN